MPKWRMTTTAPGQLGLSTARRDAQSRPDRPLRCKEGAGRLHDSAGASFSVRLGYRPELDGLRAFAVLAVIVLHYFNAPGFFVGGFLGVDLFFILSGFLITRLLLEERRSRNEIGLRDFYVRRAARLLPALLLISFVALADASTLRLLGSTKRTVFSVVAALGYLTNWVGVFHVSSVLDHTWSLSVEEQFYIIWPVALVVLYRVGSIRAVRIGAAAVVVVAAIQMAVRSLLGVSAQVLYQSTDAHGAVMLMAGCFLATTMPVGRALQDHALGRLSRQSILIVLASIILLVTTVSWTSSFYYRGGFVLVAGLFALLIARSLQPGILARGLSSAPIVWVGRISYGLYLWHIPVYVALRSGAPTLNNNLAASLAIVITIAAATASFYLVEMPIRKAAVRFQRRGNELTVSIAPTILPA